MKLKVGDKLICQVNLPYNAQCNEGDVIIVTKVNVDGAGFSFRIEGDEWTGWAGSLNSKHWKPYKVELTNK